MAVTGTPIGSTTVTGVLATLVESLQNTTRDTTGTDSEKLWSEAEWIEYLNDAEREICRRAHLITDYSTSAICDITLATDTASYSISSNILFIKRATHSDGTTTTHLKKRTKEWLDENLQGWEDLDSSTPNEYIEEANHKLIMVPAPSSTYNGDTVTIEVNRLPKTDLSANNTTPEIDEKYYTDMKTWALYMAYNKDDSQILKNDPDAPNRANRYYSIFEASVGRRANANQERVAKEQPASLRFMPRRR